MSITIFGFFWMVCLLISFFIQRIDYIVFFTLLAAVLQCNNVFIINEKGIGPFIISCIVFLIYYFFIIKKKSIKYKKDYLHLSLFLVLIAVIASIIFNKVSLDEVYIMKILQLVIYLTTFICMRKLSAFKNFNVDKMFLIIIDFVLIIGIIQFFISLGIIPKSKMLSTFIYNEETNMNLAYNSSKSKRLFSTFMEPSFCSAFLLAALCFLIYKNDFKLKYTSRIVLLIIEIILTFSTTAYAGLFLLAITYFFSTKNKKILIFIIPFLICGIILLSATGALDSVIINKGTTGSAITRNAWNKYSYQNFLESPIYGKGYKMYRASSIFYELLGNTGLLGILSFGFMIYNFANKIPCVESNKKGIIYAVLVVIACLLMAIPDLDFCVLWFIIYVYGLSFPVNDIHKIKEAC